MGATGVLELPNRIKESSVSSEVKMVIEANHVSFLKKRIKKSDIKR
jgi:hypothetical protein